VSPVVSLRGREHEARVIELLAAAQIHRDPVDAAARAPDIAEEYARSRHLDLWAWERGGEVLAVAGVESAHADGICLRDLAVEASRRGTGIGRTLIDWLSARYPGGDLFGDTLEPSVGFYRACGFEVSPAGALPSGEVVYRFVLGD
jgi:GNAT superfamily N-acetyltransferase